MEVLDDVKQETIVVVRDDTGFYVKIKIDVIRKQHVGCNINWLSNLTA